MTFDDFALVVRCMLSLPLPCNILALYMIWKLPCTGCFIMIDQKLELKYKLVFRNFKLCLQKSHRVYFEIYGRNYEDMQNELGLSWANLSSSWELTLLYKIDQIWNS